MVDIFTMVDGQIVLSPNLFIVPEFEKIINTREDALLFFKYIYSLYHYDSAYADVPEKDKEDMIIKDLKLDISLDDSDVIAAKKKADTLYTTPTKRFYLDAKKGMENLGSYLNTAELESGRDGNLSAVVSALKSVGVINAQFKILDKEYKEEKAAGIRGSGEIGYDEM